MTAQIAEYLTYQDTDYSLFTQPLEQWFRQSGRRPPFSVPHTACWRGYIGSWAITGDRLFLIELEGKLQSGDPVTLRSVFPEEEGPVFAVWFSGDLRCPTGELVEYVHQGFQSRYASEITLRVENGIVTSVARKSEDA